MLNEPHQSLYNLRLLRCRPVKAGGVTESVLFVERFYAFFEVFYLDFLFFGLFCLCFDAFAKVVEPYGNYGNEAKRWLVSMPSRGNDNHHDGSGFSRTAFSHIASLDTFGGRPYR